MLVEPSIGHSMFSFIDSFNAYNQIQIDPYDAEKIFEAPWVAFTIWSCYLVYAGAIYQCVMTVIFHNMFQEGFEDYVNDILAKS